MWLATKITEIIYLSLLLLLKSVPQLNYRFFTDVQGTIIMFDVSKKQTLVNALSDRGSSRGRRQKSWLKEVDYRAEDDNLPVKILG